MPSREAVDWRVGTDALPTVERLIRAGGDRALHLGAQLYVSLHGEVIADVGMGEAKPRVPLTTTSVVPWACNSKPVTAIVIGQLWDRGELDLDAPVAEYVSEFGAHSKDAITLRHLLTHTSGLSADASPVAFLRPWDDVVEAVCELRPLRRPGEGFHYIARSAWLVLGEVVRRLSGEHDYAAYVHARVFEPLEMEQSWLATTRERFVACGDALVPYQGLSAAGPIPYLHPWNEPACAPLCSPGDSGRGPVRELARLYESILGVAGRPPLVRLETAKEMTRPRTVDRRKRVDWGLGFMADHFGFRVGRQLQPDGAFGHDGGQMLSLGDWRHGLVALAAFNGQPRRSLGRGDPSLLRQQLFVTALYRDLGLSVLTGGHAGSVRSAEEQLSRFLGTVGELSR